VSAQKKTNVRETKRIRGKYNSKTDSNHQTLKRLHNVLLAHPGKCPVEIHALGQVFYPQIGVSADDALQKKVREFTG
jgi:hypothetical protein